MTSATMKVHDFTPSPQTLINRHSHGPDTTY